MNKRIWFGAIMLIVISLAIGIFVGNLLSGITIAFSVRESYKVYTPTADRQGTLVAEAEGKATQILEEAFVSATRTVYAQQEDYQRLLTAEAVASKTPTPSSTPQPTSTPWPTPTTTPSFTPPGVSELRIAVVEDNSGGGQFRQQTSKALAWAFPEATIFEYSECSREYLKVSFQYVVMDYTMRASPLNGAECTRKTLKMHPSTTVIGYAMDGWEGGPLMAAGAKGFVKKPDIPLLIETIYKFLDP